MQATGNNRSSLNDKKLSIRLRQGGQSFSLDTLSAPTSPTAVAVEIDTSLSAAYPDDTALSAAEVLAAEGIEVPEGWQVVVGHLPQLSVSVAAVVSQQALDATSKLAERYGATTTMFEPLLGGAIIRAMESSRRSVRVALTATEENLYIGIAQEGRLLFADSFHSISPDEALYIVATIGKDFELKRAEFTVFGEQGKAVAHKLKRYYRHVKCES